VHAPNPDSTHTAGHAGCEGQARLVAGEAVAAHCDESTTAPVLALTHCTFCVCSPAPQSVLHALQPPSLQLAQVEGGVQLRVDEGAVPVHCDDATTTPLESLHCTVSVCVPWQLQAVGLLVTQLAVAVCVPHTPALHTEPEAEHRVLSGGTHAHTHKTKKNRDNE